MSDTKKELFIPENILSTSDHKYAFLLYIGMTWGNVVLTIFGKPLHNENPMA